MPSIKILPEYLANQIAAGEVVQRPESVVKELVENALDAGATAISVVVRNAGKQLIHVIDNGKGMEAEDLALSVVRHATSKIHTEADLHAIQSLGFRGEALASIAAVADVEIRSVRATSNSDMSPDAGSSPGVGSILTSRPGEQPELRPGGGAVGTQIIVRNLFYNVPARRKFLKSDLTEFRHISETMQRMALSRPDVRCTFHDGDVLVFDLRPASLLERVKDVLAVRDERNLVPVERDEHGIHVTGFVGSPEISRQSRSGQYLFLNGRPISSRALAHAVLTAYEHLLPSGAHPVFVLNIAADPHRVDVNVHPQKHEVKFDDERAVYVLLQSAVTSALRSAELMPAFLADLPLASQPLQSLSGSASGHTYLNRLTGEIVQGTSPMAPFTGIRVTTADNRAATAALFSSPSQVELLPVIQVGAQYLVTPTSEGMMVVDQHAAHERVLYEQMMLKGAQTSHSEQALLFSVQITFSPSEVAIIKEYREEFIVLGFRLEVLNPTTVEVQSVPADVQPGSEESVLRLVIDGIITAGAAQREQKYERLAATYASKQAIRRGDRLQPDEMRELVTSLRNCTLPHLTPDGKPTYFILPFEELSSRFK